MRLFWKFFFASVFAAALLFSIGGWMLINNFFESSLSSEISNACSENKILAGTLEKTFAGTYSDNASVRSAAGTLTAEKTATSSNASSKSTHIRISNNRFGTVYSNCSEWFDVDIIANLNSDELVYSLVKLTDSYYVRVARIITLGQQKFYLESFSNITDVFRQRNSELKYDAMLMLILIAADAIVMFFLSRRMTGPITNMRRAASELASGNTGIRVDLPLGSSEDEVLALTSDFNKMAESLETNITELKASAQRQEDFIGSFAHELKTPLTSIIGYADMLRSRELPQEQIMTSANYIFQEGKRLESLSHKMMDIVVVRNTEITKRRIRTKDLFDSVESVVRPSLSSEGAELLVSCEDAIINVDPDLFKTVLINLIDNARKALDTAGLIQFTGRIEEDSYLFSIKDNGRGIPPEDLSRITEAFYMVDKSRSRAKGGAGLGLAVCSEICRLHDTKLEYESFVGIGTTVRVRISGCTPLSYDPEEYLEDDYVTE